MKDIVAELDEFTEDAGKKLVVLLPKVTRESYVRWVDTMYHFTRHAGDRLRFAASTAAHEDLRTMLTKLAAEEQNHYKLAERDLASFNEVPSATAPPEVTAWSDFFYSLRDVEFVGHLYVIESVAPRFGAALPPHWERLGLTKEQVRFAFAHIEADLEHGSVLGQMAKRYEATHREPMIEAGRKTVEHAIRLHGSSVRE